MVSIAGPCRKGKSYILSKAFDQGEVFPLGHFLDPETMGILMWIVPEKFKVLITFTNCNFFSPDAGTDIRGFCCRGRSQSGYLSDFSKIHKFPYYDKVLALGQWEMQLTLELVFSDFIVLTQRNQWDIPEVQLV